MPFVTLRVQLRGSEDPDKFDAIVKGDAIAQEISQRDGVHSVTLVDVPEPVYRQGSEMK